MATRSRIGLQLNDEAILSVYHHWDGYPEWLGVTLKAKFNTREKVAELMVREVFDLRPKGIIKMLDLKRPIYQDTAAYGHFGREEEEFTWEKTDLAEKFQLDAGL